MPELLLEKSEAVEDVFREVKIKSIIRDAVEDGVESALQAIKQGRDVADEAIVGAQRAAKQNLLQSLGVIFAIGVVTGAMMAWVGSRRYS